MKVDVRHSPSFAVARVELDPRGQFRAESGTMMATSAGVDVQASTQGGVMKGLKRSLLGDDIVIDDDDVDAPVTTPRRTARHHCILADDDGGPGYPSDDPIEAFEAPPPAALKRTRDLEPRSRAAEQLCASKPVPAGDQGRRRRSGAAERSSFSMFGAGIRCSP